MEKRKLSVKDIEEREREDYFFKHMKPWKGNYKAAKECKDLNDFFEREEGKTDGASEKLPKKDR